MKWSVQMARIQCHALLPLGMLKMKLQKKSQIPGESVVAGGSRKRGDPCPEDRTTQGQGHVTV